MPRSSRCPAVSEDIQHICVRSCATPNIIELSGSQPTTAGDAAVGISVQDLPRTWARLYRADQRQSERGLGLGLSFVKAIVEAHGGRAEVQSALGSGATFIVRLPLG